MLLCGELLQQVMVGGVGRMLTLGQPVTQPVLMGKKQPHLPTSAFGDPCTQRWKDGDYSFTSGFSPYSLLLQSRNTNIFHLGRVRDTSPPCPVGLSSCLGRSVSSPTMPARLWSTGPLPGSSASSCGCAVRPCLLQHGWYEHIQHQFNDSYALLAAGNHHQRPM